MATLVAVTCIFAHPLIVDAVYRPVEEMVPPPQSMRQVTAVLLRPDTAAVSCSV